MIAITPVVLLIMPVRLHVLERMVRVSHTQTGAHLTLTICNVGDGIWLSGTPHQGCGVRLLHRWSPNRSPFMRFAVPIMAFISRSVNRVRISCCPGMGQTLSGWGSGSSITQLLMDMWICRACVHVDVVRHMIGEVLMGVISACGMGTLALSLVIGKGSIISSGIWIVPFGPTSERGGDVACGTWMDPHKQMRRFEGRQPGDQESGVRLRAGENRSCCACRDCSW